jgi:hypothetical protein
VIDFPSQRLFCCCFYPQKPDLDSICFCSLVSFLFDVYSDASNNGFTGSVPSFIANSLVEIILSNNKFDGGFPDTLADLDSLNKLYLDNNTLSGTIPSDFNSTSLNFIHLEGNGFHGRLPVWNFTITSLNLSGNSFDFCDQPFALRVAFCDISNQGILSCGCNIETFYNRCLSDIEEECSPLTPLEPTSPPTESPTSTPTVSPPTLSPPAPTTTTPPPAPSPVTPPPIAPPGGCSVNTKAGFVCRGGIWYHDGNFDGTNDILFEDPVVMGTHPTDEASFVLGVFTFLNTLTVHGTARLGADSNLTFTNIDFGTRRNPAVPRLTADCVLAGGGGFAIVLTAEDLNFATGRLVSMYQSECDPGVTPPFRVITPITDCRTVSHTSSVTGSAPYVVRVSLAVDDSRCGAPNNQELPPSKKSSNWWVGLLIALIVLAVIIIAAVLIAIFVPAVRNRLYPIFASNKAQKNHGSDEEGGPEALSGASVAGSGTSAASGGAIVAVKLDDIGESGVEESSQEESSQEESSEEEEDESDTSLEDGSEDEGSEEGSEEASEEEEESSQ